MPATIDISSQLLAAPRNCWLALSADESTVVAHGATMEEAAAAAQQKGVGEPVLLWAPEKWTPRVY